MELTWPIKLRIGAAAAIGVYLIGILAWPLVAPPDPFSVVSLVSRTLTLGDAGTLMGLAFFAGLAAYFLAWPHGQQIGIVAAPAGLAVWAWRSGQMGTLMQLDATIARRQELLSTMRWESLLWLGVVGAGYIGVIVGWLIRHKATTATGEAGAKRRMPPFLSWVVAIGGSAIVAQFFIGIIARDTTILDPMMRSVTGQPATAQLMLAVVVSFGLAGFLVKKVLDLDYICPIMSTCLVTPLAIRIYAGPDVLDYLVAHWPAVFFVNPVLTALPIQVVAFGTLGCVAGYWLAVRYAYGRQHEMDGGK